MAKKILIGLAGMLVVVAGVAALSAYEAHVINVTAHIENALSVPTEPIVFGTVFPQEMVTEDFTMGLSASFLAQNRVDTVEYKIVQKPKCICDSTEYTNKELCPVGKYAPVDYATDVCPTKYHQMESLCPFLSKTDADPDDNNDTSHPSYYIEDAAGDHCLQPTRIDRTQEGFGDGGWAGWSCPAGMIAISGGIDSSTNPVGGHGVAAPGAPAVDTYNYPVYPHYTFPAGETGYVVHDLVDGLGNTIKFHVDCLPIVPDASGKLVKGADISDSWTVDLKVPPVAGYVGQDWPAGCPTVPTNDVDYGCDLWIEVTGISRVGT